MPVNNVGPESISIEDLVLDPENPRLPEELRGQGPATLLTHMWANEAIDELVRSLLENGYFQHEPLIVGPARRDGKHVVLEGNRRLAALLVIHNAPEAEDIPRPDPAPTGTQLGILQEIPCIIVSERDDIRKFVGFRHIGGIKRWKPEAKARYLVDEVRRAVQSGIPQPFLNVARRVGSNVQGVRNSYLALCILMFARDEFGVNVNYVQYDRFGVWLRCMNSEDIRRYIGLDSPRTYDDIEARLRNLHETHLTEVLRDLTPTEGQQAVLRDSRFATLYGRVLSSDRARRVLRKYNDLDVAMQVIIQAELPSRIRRLADQCEVLLSQVGDAEPSDALWAAVSQLYSVARNVRAVIKDRRNNDE